MVSLSSRTQVKFRWTRLLGVFVGLFVVLGLVSHANAAYPGKNGKIVFASDRAPGGPDYEIYSMDRNGSEIRQLTNITSHDSVPSFSADCTRIAFNSNREGGTEVWVMDADGRNQRRLTNSAGFNRSPHFSPDGTKVVFESSRSGDVQVWEVNSVLGEATAVQLTSSSNIDYPGFEFGNPRYKPDGSALALFGANLQNYPNSWQIAVFIANADGTNLRQFTDYGIEAANSDWSPDGSRITFADNFVSDLQDIFVATAPGSGPITPITRAQAQQITSTGNNPFPKFSPEGTELVFMAEPTATLDPFNVQFRHDILTTNLTGSVFNNLTPNGTSVDEVYPDWGPKPKKNERG